MRSKALFRKWTSAARASLLLFCSILPETTLGVTRDRVPLFPNPRVMTAGGLEMDQDSLSLHGSGWLSLRFRVPRSGWYGLGREASRSPEGDAVPFSVLWDGQPNAGSPTPLFSGQGSLPVPPVFLRRGPHSLILRAQGPSGRSFLGRLYLEPLSPGHSPPDPSDPWTTLSPGVRLLPLGPFYTGNYINVNIARDAALFTRDGTQYTAFYDPEGHLVVARREKGTDYFEEYWLPIPGNVMDLSDPHGFISLQMDAEGFLHLAYGQHSSPLQYWRSKYPRDISVWGMPPGGMGPAAQKARVTYLSFVRLPGAQGLLALFRDGISGSGNEILLRYETSKREWRTLAAPFVSGRGRSSPYFWRPLVSPDGTLHLAWTWRLSDFAGMPDGPWTKHDFSGFTNKDICYARSPDGGTTWRRSDGTPYRLPITREGPGPQRAEVIQDVPMGEDMFNHFGGDTDNRGYPHFAYTRKDPSGIPQQWHLGWDGRHWTASVASDYRKPFSWTRSQQLGQSSPSLVRPSLAVDTSGRALLLSRGRERGNVLELFLSRGGDYGHWTRRAIFDGPLGGWEPQWDLPLWKTTGRLDLLMAGITDRAFAERSHGFRPFLGGVKGWLLGRLRRNPADYYSADDRVDIVPIDPRLGDKRGYLMELDPDRLIGPGEKEDPGDPTI